MRGWGRERRAEWFTKWTREMAEKRRMMQMSTLEEGPGRIMYVAEALEHERPFLGAVVHIPVPRSSFRTPSPSSSR